jgi:hypothetical protein
MLLIVRGLNTDVANTVFLMAAPLIWKGSERALRCSQVAFSFLLTRRVRQLNKSHFFVTVAVATISFCVNSLLGTKHHINYFKYKRKQSF